MAKSKPEVSIQSCGIYSTWDSKSKALPQIEQFTTNVIAKLDVEFGLIINIKKVDLAKDSADARPEVFSKGNALDAKITELDLINRRVKLSVKAAQIDEEKSLIAKFGEGATKSGATLKGIFEKAIGKKGKKEK